MKGRRAEKYTFKDYKMTLVPDTTNGYSIKSIYVTKKNNLLIHFCASSNYGEKEAMEYMKFRYKDDLEKKVLKILKRRIHREYVFGESEKVYDIKMVDFIWEDSESDDFITIEEWMNWENYA